MQILIRRATIADAGDIQNLTQMAYAPWADVIGQDQLPMTTNYIEMIETHTVDVLECKGDMCGVLELVSEETHVLVENIAVHPDQQGKGFGRMLIEHAEAFAFAQGIKGMRLYINAMFTSNLAFYEACGFVELERSDLIPGSITIHMNKTLKTDT